jgi:hypothetical protein
VLSAERFASHVTANRYRSLDVGRCRAPDAAQGSIASRRITSYSTEPLRKCLVDEPRWLNEVRLTEPLMLRDGELARRHVSAAHFSIEHPARTLPRSMQEMYGDRRSRSDFASRAIRYALKAEM